MGHHHHDEQPKNESQTLEQPANGNHPIFEANDLTVLSLLLPILSERGRQLVTFFINFGNQNPVNLNDSVNLLGKISPKIENSALKELLPALLTLISNPENKTALNPALLSSLLANLNANKED